MSVTAESSIDTSAPNAATESAARAPGAVSGRTTTHLQEPRLQSLFRRTLLLQAGFGLLALAVLLAGFAVSVSVAGGSEAISTSAALPLALGVGLALILLAAGVLLTRRCLRPACDVERQMHRFACSPVLSAGDVEPIQGATPFGAGWDRLVHLIRSLDQSENLHERLETAVSDYQQRKGELVLDALTDGIAVTDHEQRITRANNALGSILNLEHYPEGLVGVSIEEALARKAGKDTDQPVVESGHRGHRIVSEITCPGGDEDVVLRVCRTPLVIEAGAGKGGYVWTVRDVTQQKLADRMRDQFVNAATHELRTPMANIKAYAETLALGEVDDVEQQKMFCNVINDEVTRLARFIDDLLHLSRMEVGATTLQLQVTDMGRLLEETAKKVQPQMAQKNLKFTKEMPAKLPELIIDKDKFAVAVINLLGNAAKYTPEGGAVRLHVALQENAIQIDVEDTGIGIAEDEVSKVLDKFYRSSDPRVHGETGSGLGLSLAQEIVRLHGGQLTVSSQINKGSKFTILLPTTAE